MHHHPQDNYTLDKDRTMERTINQLGQKDYKGFLHCFQVNGMFPIISTCFYSSSIDVWWRIIADLTIPLRIAHVSFQTLIKWENSVNSCTHQYDCPAGDVSHSSCFKTWSGHFSLAFSSIWSGMWLIDVDMSFHIMSEQHNSSYRDLVFAILQITTRFIDVLVLALAKRMQASCLRY